MNACTHFLDSICNETSMREKMHERVFVPGTRNEVGL